MPVFFNGRLWTTPATMSAVDDSAMFNRNPSVGNVLAIIGSAMGGKPFTPMRFQSPQDALAVLRGGEAAEAVAMAFDPSEETGSPQEVVFVRIDPATQAVLTLKDAGNTDVIDLASTGYGRFTNEIKVKIESGSVSGKKLTTQRGNDYFSADNVGRRALSVTYTGANATATMGVTATQLTLTDAAVTTITLADYPTVGALVERINSVPGYVAAILDNNGQTLTDAALDGVTAANVKGNVVEVTANLQAIIDWFNGTGEGLITATRKPNAVTLPANTPFRYLAGGSDGVPTNSDWQSGFDALQTVDVQWIVPLSSSPSIHAMTDTHVSYMSDVARRERRAFVGGALGATDGDAVAAAKLINSDRTAYLHLGVYNYNLAGALTLYPPYVAAALIGGAFAGVSPGEPLTNKSIKVRGLERDLRNPVDTDQLIMGGVFCVENTDKGFKVVKSISTWLNNNKFNRVEVSVGAATDFVVRSAREAVDPLRGKKGSPTLLSDAVSRTDSILRELSKPEPLGPGVLVGDKANPPFKNITALLEGDVLAVQFQCSPVIGVNYIPVAVYVVPYSGTATA